MTQVLHTRVDDELAAAIRAEADKDERPVSQWIKVVLAQEVRRRSWSGALPEPGGIRGTADLTSPITAADIVKVRHEVDRREAARAAHEEALARTSENKPVYLAANTEPCRHERTVKRIARSSGLTMRECVDCGSVAPA